MKRKIAYTLIVAAAAAAIWYWRGHRAPARAAEAEKKPGAVVEVTPLKAADITRTLAVFGVIAPGLLGERTIAAPFDCMVRQVHVAAGARVATGDLLVEIDPTPETKVQLDLARGALALASKALADTQSRHALKLATNQELLAAQQTEREARLNVATSEARGVGGDGKLTAPGAGVISNLAAIAGTIVPTGTPLVTISFEERLEARLAVGPVDAAKIHPGQTVALVSANRAGGEPVSSVIRVAGATLDPVSGTFEVRVPLPANASLLQGEHVKATIDLETKAGALVVPRKAVLTEENKQVIFTVKDGKAVRQEVRVGIVSGDSVEVIGENLQANVPVITLGNNALSDGMAVQTAEQHAAEGRPVAARVYTAAETEEFIALAKAALAAVLASQQAETNAKLEEFEKAWDAQEDTLRPKNEATWVAIDDNLDNAIASMGGRRPDFPKGKALLEDLLKKLEQATTP